MTLDLDAIRNHTGALPAFSSIGGYPIIYVDRNNDVLCAPCTDKLDPEFDAPIIDYDVYWEGPPIACEGCNADIDSAYGDPDETKAITVEAADYHRNGVGGDGFMVALIRDEEYGGRFLFIDFYPNAHDDSVEDSDQFRYTVAALDIDLAATGNIHMADGNAWRGDNLAERWRPAVREFRNASAT